MSPLETTIWWIVVAAGLCGSALLSGLETGVYRLNRVKLEVRAARGPSQHAARLLKGEVAQLPRLLSANIIANVIFGDMAAMGMTSLLAAKGYSEGVIILINAAILTPIMFVCVESIPKEVFRVETDRLTYRFAGFLSFLRVALTICGLLPLVLFIMRISMKALRISPESALVSTGRERVLTLLKDSAGDREAAAPLSESQAKLLDRAVEFGRTRVTEEMLPWNRVFTIRASWSRSTVVSLLSRSPQPFLPVTDRDSTGRVRVTGILNARDLFARPEVPMARLAVEPQRIPARMTLADAAAVLQASPVPCGVVEDAGRPVGLISLSDLFEPLLRPDEP